MCLFCRDLRKALWNSHGMANNNKIFIASQIYDEIREIKPLVRWNKIVWFKRGIPKYQTLIWLFVLNRCPTRNRLVSWGIHIDPSYLICNKALESMDNIFFTCDYSSRIWKNLASKLQLALSSDFWIDTITALVLFFVNCHLCFLSLLALQEKNNRLHRHNFKSTDAVLTQIDSILETASLRLDTKI